MKKYNLTEKQEKKLKESAAKWKTSLLSLLEDVRLGNKISDKYYWYSLGDIREFIVYCDFIRDGIYDKAYKMDFDTCARETIPTPIWETIEYKLYK